MFTITLNTDNAAFADDGATEIARILRQMATHLDNNPLFDGGGPVRDINGNTVGDWAISGPAVR